MEETEQQEQQQLQEMQVFFGNTKEKPLRARNCAFFTTFYELLCFLIKAKQFEDTKIEIQSRILFRFMQ